MTAHTDARTPQGPSLRAKLDVLHAEYAEAINYAIAADRDDLVASLAAEYDDEATRMVAEHEGKTHLLPIRRVQNAPARGRRWLPRLERRQSPA